MKTKQVTLTVDITIEIPSKMDADDINSISFRGIEKAVPQFDGADCGKVVGYCTQEYIGEDIGPS